MKRLTLYLDEAVIKSAKKIAKQSDMSLSAVVREFFRVGVLKGNFESLYGLPPQVVRMIGIIPDTGQTDKQIREAYHKHIRDKRNKI